MFDFRTAIHRKRCEIVVIYVQSLQFFVITEFKFGNLVFLTV